MQEFITECSGTIILMESQNIIMYGTVWCPDCHLALSILDEMQVSYVFIDIDRDDSAAQYVMVVNHGNRSVPTIIFPNGNILVEPSRTDLEKAILDGRPGS